MSELGSVCGRNDDDDVSAAAAAVAGEGEDGALEDDDSSGSDSDVAVLSCLGCGEGLEAYWELCPRCLRQAKAGPSLTCAAATCPRKMDGENFQGCFRFDGQGWLACDGALDELDATWWCSCDDFRAGIGGHACGRACRRDWIICPDCKLGLRNGVVDVADGGGGGGPATAAAAAAAADGGSRIAEAEANEVTTATGHVNLRCSTCGGARLPLRYFCSRECVKAATAAAMAAVAETKNLAQHLPPPRLAPTPRTDAAGSGNTVPPGLLKALPAASLALAARELGSCGHCAVRKLLSRAEVEALRPLLLDAAARKAARTVTNKGTQGKPFTRVHNLWRESAAARAVSLCPRLASAASALLGVRTVRLYQDSLFVKQHGDDASPWHRDIVAAPIETDKFLSIWIPLTRASGTAEAGTLVFASGSHVASVGGEGREGTASGGGGGGGGGGGAAGAGAGAAAGAAATATATTATLVAAKYRERSSKEVREEFGPAQSHAPLLLGDATVHLGTTLHASGPNVAGEDREAFVVCFVSSEDRIEERNKDKEKKKPSPTPKPRHLATVRRRRSPKE